MGGLSSGCHIRCSYRLPRAYCGERACRTAPAICRDWRDGGRLRQISIDSRSQVAWVGSVRRNADFPEPACLMRMTGRTWSGPRPGVRSPGALWTSPVPSSSIAFSSCGRSPMSLPEASRGRSGTAPRAKPSVLWRTLGTNERQPEFTKVYVQYGQIAGNCRNGMSEPRMDSDFSTVLAAIGQDLGQEAC